LKTVDYAGDVTSAEAWKILSENERAVLVDVRTREEWMFVGVPDTRPAGRETVFVSWQRLPTMEVNAAFADEVGAAGVVPDQTVLLLCRSGARSRAAAVSLTARGFRVCFNVSDGFEGGHDQDGHRGTVAGWKVAGLPWRQD
jgi:rhodanese-related sulfurtransferase